jgi:selenocysteine-specific elongation factor
MADARLELSAREKKPLAQRARVRIHHGTDEVMARVVLLDREALQPGESALAQLRLESPLVAAAGDVFVIRSYSPMFVIGGGSIVDPHPPKRRKAAGAEDVARRESSPVQEVILEALDRAGARGVEFGRLLIHCAISESALRSTLAEMKTGGLAADGRRDVWFSAGALRDMQAMITGRLARLHAESPLRPFAALNAVSAGAAPEPETRECFRLALDGLRDRGEVVGAGERVGLASHKPQWVGRFAAARERILAKFSGSGLSAPLLPELAALAGLAEADCTRALEALAEAGELTLLAPGVYVHPEVFARARDRVKEFLARNGQLNIAQARDMLGASRKYLLPFLEELDRQGLTARQGDFRTLAR